MSDEKRDVLTNVMNDDLRDWLTKASIREWGEEFARKEIVPGYDACPNGTVLPKELPEDVDEKDMTPPQQVVLSLSYFCGNVPVKLRFPEDWKDFRAEEDDE